MNPFAISLFAQAVVPPEVLPINGWNALVLVMPGILAFLGTIAALVVGVINGHKTDGIGRKTDDVAKKTDIMHGMLNSELDKFRADTAANYKVALQQAVALTRAESEKTATAIVTALETRIARLESELRARNDQNAVTQPRPSPAAETAAAIIIADTAAAAAALVSSDATTAKALITSDAVVAAAALTLAAATSEVPAAVADSRIATGRLHD